MKTITLTTVLVFLTSPIFGAGGLECMNEPPSPSCTETSAWVACQPGFGNGASLSAAIDTSNGDTRVGFTAGGSFPGDKPLTFWHNSRDNRTYPSGVGRNSSFNILLYEHPDEWYLTPVRIVLGNGYRVSFDQNMDGTYRGEPGVFSRLYKDSDGSYRLYTNDSPDMVDDGDVLYRFGQTDSAGRARLQSVTTSAGRITFAYVTSGYGLGEITRVRDEASGSEAVFSYNSLGQLATVTSADGVVTRLTYNSSGDMSLAQSDWGTLTFDYNADHNISTITDGLEGHAAFFSYAEAARANTFRDSSNNVTDLNYTISATGGVASVVFGSRGSEPTTYEFSSNRLLTSAAVPGEPKVSYTYTADKCLSGQSYSTASQGTKVADAASSQPPSGS